MAGPPIDPPDTYYVYVDTECDHCGRVLYEEWRGAEGECRVACPDCEEYTSAYAWRQL